MRGGREAGRGSAARSETKKKRKINRGKRDTAYHAASVISDGHTEVGKRKLIFDVIATSV